MKWLYWKMMALLTPGCWVSSSKYNKQWDRRLRGLMENFRFECLDDYTVKLGPETIWVANHPYASFSPIDRNIPASTTPSRATRLMAMDQLIKDFNEKVRK